MPSLASVLRGFSKRDEADAKLLRRCLLEDLLPRCEVAANDRRSQVQGSDAFGCSREPAGNDDRPPARSQAGPSERGTPVRLPVLAPQLACACYITAREIACEKANKLVPELRAAFAELLGPMGQCSRSR
jgi:hypothetical protein